MNLELASWTDAAAAQLLQVTLVAIAVAIVVRLTARSRPHLAYLLWMLVIVKCLTPPLAASRTSLFSWAWAEQSPAAISEPHQAATPQSIPMDEVGLDELPKHIESPASEAVPGLPVIVPSDDPIRHSVSPAASLFAGWAIGALSLAGYIGVKWVRFQRRVKRTRVTIPRWLSDRVARLSSHLGLRRVSRIVLSSDAIGPLSMGIWRPTIVLPAALVDDSHHAALEPILAHELLHLRRGDVIVGHLQLVAQTVWWFHPMVWWANREARRERERCCDEAVLTQLDCKPNDYAQAMIDVLDVKHRFSRSALLPVATASDVNDRRLRHIMHPAARFHRHTPRWCWLVVVIAAALCLPGAGLMQDAQNSDDTSRQTNKQVADAPVSTGQEEEVAADANTTEPVQIAGTLAADPAAEVTSTFYPHSDDHQSLTFKFSQRHDEAVKRLQELGAAYSATMNTRTNRPHVAIAIPQHWKGTTDDWRLLADLDVVSSVDINHTGGDESGLDVLAELEELTELTLSKPTPKAIATIGALSGLTRLSLHGYREPSIKFTADDLTPLARLTNLKRLGLYNAPFDDAALQHIGKLRQLRRLDLGDLPITDAGIEHLSTLDHLRELWISDSSMRTNRVAVSQVSGTGLASLARLPRLTSLHFTGPMVTDEGLSGVAQLQGLEQLHLYDATNVTPKGINALGKMTRLKKLGISGPQLDGDDFQPLAAMENLRSLVLGNGADLRDAGALHIAGLTKLRELSMRGRGLTDRGMLALAGLSDLWILSLQKTQVSTNMLDHLTKLRELKYLKFDAKRIDDDAAKKLGEFPNLVKLELDGSQITDVGLARLVQHDGYLKLGFDNTQITDKGLVALPRLRNLLKLSLSGTSITDAGLEKIEQFQKLKWLNILDTNVTEEGVQKLAEALPSLETILHRFDGRDSWTEVEFDSYDVTNDKFIDDDMSPPDQEDFD